MSSPNGFSQKTINLESRSFYLQILKFGNGSFVSVTEGTNNLGSMVVSLATGPTPVTTTIIPSKSESLFLRLIAERISTQMRGIAVVSAFIQKELDPTSAKAIMTEIMELVKN